MVHILSGATDPAPTNRPSDSEGWRVTSLCQGWAPSSGSPSLLSLPFSASKEPRHGLLTRPCPYHPLCLWSPVSAQSPGPVYPPLWGPRPPPGPHGACLQLFKPLQNVSRITFLLTPNQAPPDATNKEDAVLSKCQFRGMSSFSSGFDYGFYSFTLSPSS